MGLGNESRHNCDVHTIEQDGVRLAKPLAGHPALELCNTWAGWVEDPPPGSGDARREWLPDYDALVVWMGFHQLLDAAQVARLRAAAAAHPEEAEAVLVEVRELRPLVRAAVLAPEDADALGELREPVRRAAAAAQLVPGREGVRWIVTDHEGLDLPVLVLAWSAAELLASPEVRHVSACPGVDCGWVFLDPRGRRRWCDMSVCGNRAKVAAHARRSKQTHPPAS
jgi:predicted RNA-binding Zn ribbon-like protein